MSGKKGILKGPKFNGRHSTYIDTALPLITAASAQPEVSKVILGPIENTHAHGSHFRIRPQASGALKLLVSGGGASQTIYVYTTEATATTAALNVAWERSQK